MYISETLRKQFPSHTLQFIVSLSKICTLSSLALLRLSRKAWFLSAMESLLLDEEEEFVEEAEVWREWEEGPPSAAEGDSGGQEAEAPEAVEEEWGWLYMSPS